MKTDDAYTKIMNQLDVLHREHVFLINLIFVLYHIEESKRVEIIDLLDKKWKDERTDYSTD